MRAGATILARVTSLTPARLAALAACGIESVDGPQGAARHHRRHGDGAPPTRRRCSSAGQIYESNGHHARRRPRRRRVPSSSGSRRPRTREDALAAALERRSRRTSSSPPGGVSVGPHDLVRRVQARLGVEEVFWGVAMRPGQAARVRRAAAGHSSSACPGTRSPRSSERLLFVRPALLALRAIPTRRRRSGPASSPSEIPQRPERDDFVRARVDVGRGAGRSLDPIVGQESHMIVAH